MQRTLITAAGLVAIAAALIACGPSGDAGDGPVSAAADAKPVFASNYPMAFFSERLLDSADAVYFPEIDGDPAFWNPSREQISQIQGAKLLAFNGASYEKWAAKTSLHKDRVVETARAFKDAWIKTEDKVTHSHGKDGEHSHAGTAFTTWLDLSQAKQQLASLRDALVAAKLGPAEAIGERHDALAAELEALDQELLKLTSEGGEIPLVASHPVYQYFARRYKLKLKAVLWEPETDPGEEGWKALDELLEGHDAKWMIWEGTPLPATVAKLEEKGIRSIVFDPCGNRPDEGDFLSVMKANLANLKPIFAK